MSIEVVNKIGRLHLITQEIAGFAHSAQAEEACQAGADWIQVRVKDFDQAQWLEVAKACKSVCDRYNATCIVNDNVEIAKAINASGIHLGKSDISPLEARKILGKNFIIGATANSVADVMLLLEMPIDYIGLGPFRYTSTKKNLSPLLGLDGVSAIAKKYGTKMPLIAIGGILPDDMDALATAGIFGVAVSGAVFKASDRLLALSEFSEKIKKASWNH
jgi:thiamine-phosphate pyrophosphorylase